MLSTSRYRRYDATLHLRIRSLLEPQLCSDLSEQLCTGLSAGLSVLSIQHFFLLKKAPGFHAFESFRIGASGFDVRNVLVQLFQIIIDDFTDKLFLFLFLWYPIDGVACSLLHPLRVAARVRRVSSFNKPSIAPCHFASLRCLSCFFFASAISNSGLNLSEVRLPWNMSSSGLSRSLVKLLLMG